MLAAPFIPDPGGVLLLVVEPEDDAGRWRYGFLYDQPDFEWQRLSVHDGSVSYDDPAPGWLDGVAGDLALSSSTRQAINVAKPLGWADHLLHNYGRPPAVGWKLHLRRKFRRPLSRSQRRHVAE